MVVYGNGEDEGHEGAREEGKGDGVGCSSGLTTRDG